MITFIIWLKVVFQPGLVGSAVTSQSKAINSCFSIVSVRITAPAALHNCLGNYIPFSCPQLVLERQQSLDKSVKLLEHVKAFLELMPHYKRMFRYIFQQGITSWQDAMVLLSINRLRFFTKYARGRL